MEDKWPRGPLFQERRSYKNVPCWTWIVCVYAGMISGAFVAVTVLGVLHLQDVERRCQTPAIERTMASRSSDTIAQQTSEEFLDLEAREDYGEDKFRRYTLRDQYLEETELVDVNIRSGKAVFYFPATVETMSGMAVIDYYHHLGGLHVSGGKERCYLVKDLDQYFPNIVSLQTFLESGKRQERRKGSTNLDLEVSNYGDPLTDLDTIPKELHDVCWGKIIYWLKQVAVQDDSRDDTELTVAVITGTGTLFLTIREQ